LKGSGRRILLFSGPANGIPDDLCQLPRGTQGSGSEDRTGDTPGETFLSVAPNDVRKVGFFQVVDQVGGSLTLGGVKAHIQQTVMSEGEAAFALVKLHGGHTKVHHDPVDTLPAVFLQDFSALQVRSLDYLRAMTKGT